MKQATPSANYDRPLHQSEFAAVHRGLSYVLLLPAGRARVGVVISHGAGSRKENHLDFARFCQRAGMASLCFDARGHGASHGVFGPGAVDDVIEMCRVMSVHADQVCVRGSSMGGLVAIQAAARLASIAAVVAICPAPEDILLSRLESRDTSRFLVAEAQFRRWLQSTSLAASVKTLGPRTGLMLCHAAADEQVPVSVSRSLYAIALPPKRLLISGGGNHRFCQHDLTAHQASVEFIARTAECRRRAGSGQKFPPNAHCVTNGVELGRAARLESR